MAYGDYGWSGGDSGYAYNMPQQTGYDPNNEFPVSGDEASGSYGFGKTMPLYGGSEYAAGSPGAAAEQAWNLPQAEQAPESESNATGIMSTVGGLGGQIVGDIWSRVSAMERRAANRDALRAVYMTPGVGYKDQLQGMADISAEINQLRKGQMSDFQRQRVSNAAARRMGARGIRGAAAKLAMANAENIAEDRYSQWRLNQLSQLIDQRQRIAQALQADDLRRRAAMEAYRRSFLEQGQDYAGLFARALGGTLGGFAGYAIGGGSGVSTGANLGATLGEAMGRWGGQPAPASGGYQPFDYSAYYDSLYK